MREARNLIEVNQILKQVLDRLDRLETKDIDLRGRRLVNLGDAERDEDAVNLKFLLEKLNSISPALAAGAQALWSLGLFRSIRIRRSPDGTTESEHLIFETPTETQKTRLGPFDNAAAVARFEISVNVAYDVAGSYTLDNGSLFGLICSFFTTATDSGVYIYFLDTTAAVKASMSFYYSAATGLLITLPTLNVTTNYKANGVAGVLNATAVLVKVTPAGADGSIVVKEGIVTQLNPPT